MARVYQAEDERLGRLVAVKVLHESFAGQPEFVRRFEQEAQLAASLTHPHIVAIYDVGRDNETYFIVMEFVAGEALKNVIVREAPLPLEQVIPIMQQLGLALDAAHSCGIVHRDIKPENILIAGDSIKVGDFGIARAVSSSRQTATGLVLGSASYFSPEQAQGRPATAQSDIYSSGVVLYEMLTGRRPFISDNPVATAMQHVTDQPVPPSMLVPSLSPAVDRVVLQALDKRPSQRFHTATALADALIIASNGGALSRGQTAQQSARVTARTQDTRPHTSKIRRGPLAFLLFLILLTAIVLLQHHTIPPLVHSPSSRPIPRTDRRATRLPQGAATVPSVPSPPLLSGASAGITVGTGYAAIGSGGLRATGPHTNFDPTTRQVYAVFTLHNVPSTATVQAVWSFPDGRTARYVWSGVTSPYRWTSQPISGPGLYTVSATTDSTTIGHQTFSVTSISPSPLPTPG